MPTDGLYCPCCAQPLELRKQLTTKGKLLRLLMETQGQYITTKAITRHLDISKYTAYVHICQLRPVLAKEGYYIDSRPGHGYRLCESPTLNRRDQ